MSKNLTFTMVLIMGGILTGSSLPAGDYFRTVCGLLVMGASIYGIHGIKK